MIDRRKFLRSRVILLHRKARQIELVLGLCQRGRRAASIPRIEGNHKFTLRTSIAEAVWRECYARPVRYT